KAPAGREDGVVSPELVLPRIDRNDMSGLTQGLQERLSERPVVGTDQKVPGRSSGEHIGDVANELPVTGGEVGGVAGASDPVGGPVIRTNQHHALPAKA